MQAQRQHQVQPQLEFVEIYYIKGGAPKHWERRYGVSDPPTAGQSRAVLIRGEKYTTIFCPYNLWAQQVRNDCAEVSYAKKLPFDPDHVAGIITRKWEDFAKLNQMVDYDMAAAVLTAMGKPVPRIVVERPKDADGNEIPSARSNGKPVIPEALRPIKRPSKRAEVAEFFLTEEPQSIREAMARLGLTRSGVLSHLFCINRDNGLGYELANDCARLVVPPGHRVFVAKGEKAEEPAKPAAKGEEDLSWLD